MINIIFISDYAIQFLLFIFDFHFFFMIFIFTDIFIFLRLAYHISLFLRFLLLQFLRTYLFSSIGFFISIYFFIVIEPSTLMAEYFHLGFHISYFHFLRDASSLRSTMSATGWGHFIRETSVFSGASASFQPLPSDAAFQADFAIEFHRCFRLSSYFQKSAFAFCVFSEFLLRLWYFLSLLGRAFLFSHRAPQRFRWFLLPFLRFSLSFTKDWARRFLLHSWRIIALDRQETGHF